jgi:glutaminyl-peptide cyclotransferase
MPAGFADEQGKIYNSLSLMQSPSIWPLPGGKMCKVGEPRRPKPVAVDIGWLPEITPTRGRRCAWESVSMSQVASWVIGGVMIATMMTAPLGCWATTSTTSSVDPPKFAEDAVPKNLTAIDLKFDPERALKYLKQVCDIGPRMSGTEGMKKQQELIEKHFKDHGASVTRQEFQARQRSRRANTAMANLIITWHPERNRRVIVCSHYDTRPIADQEANPNNWNKPFVSANDGASGVAWMMEMAHHMKGLKTEIGVDFVLFDGEEYVFETNRLGGDKYFFGSEHFADEYTKTAATRKHQYAAAVLLDLFAAKGTVLRVEQHSWEAAPRICQQIWGTADAIGAKSFRAEQGADVLDDHIALNAAGIPAVDLIDFDYPHWHKLSDTPDKVSGEQMAEVAKVLGTWISTAK